MKKLFAAISSGKATKRRPDSRLRFIRRRVGAALYIGFSRVREPPYQPAQGMWLNLRGVSAVCRLRRALPLPQTAG